MPYKIYKHTQPLLNNNNEDYESVSTLSSNLRCKSYETNINQNEKKCPSQTKTRKSRKNNNTSF